MALDGRIKFDSVGADLDMQIKVEIAYQAYLASELKALKNFIKLSKIRYLLRDDRKHSVSCYNTGRCQKQIIFDFSSTAHSAGIDRASVS